MGVHERVVVGETRDLRDDGKTRAEEINDWLTNPNLYQSKNRNTFVNSWQVSSWVSLDDMDLASIQPNEKAKVKHIMLNPKLGLCGTKNIIAAVVQGLIKANCLDRSLLDIFQHDGPYLKAPPKSLMRSAERRKAFYNDGSKTRLSQSASDLLSFPTKPEVESVRVLTDIGAYESWGTSSVESNEPIFLSETDLSIDMSQRDVNHDFSIYSCLTLNSELSNTV